MAKQEAEQRFGATDDVLKWLLSAEAYGKANVQVELVQTHISWVFLTDELVIKCKKPVRFDFLDFSSLTQRELACRDELRLNSRLAPSTYLGVWAIVRDADGGLAWQTSADDGREVVDWVVAMRKLPLERTLDRLLARDALLPEHVETLADRLEEFYRQQVPLPVTAELYHSTFGAHICANTEVLLAAEEVFTREKVLRVQGWQMQVLELQRDLLDQRAQSQRIFDGHGDLRPEHICFADELAIFDCIEFRADFRQIDVLDELAFLAAECDFLGASWVGEQLLRRYQQKSGDVAPEVLWNFYKAYRATIRAKVAVLRAKQLSGEEKQAALDEARKHFDGADGYARLHVRPLLLLVGGLSGSGKSTLAQQLANQMAAECLRSDVYRQLQHAEATSLEAKEERYSLAARDHVYQALFEKAKQLLSAGVSVVLDATFSRASSLEQAIEVGKEVGAKVLAVECVCRPEVVQGRIAARQQKGTDASEATFEVYLRQRQEWEAWPASIPQCQIQTELPLEQQVSEVVKALKG